MFDERFARQYRFDLPPRFPLASVYTSKVHHLSGPFGSALTHTAHRRSPTVDAALALASYTYFHFAYQFFTGTLALTNDSLVRVSRRVY